MESPPHCWQGTDSEGNTPMMIATVEDFPPQERPSCPLCGANHTVSCSIKWQCGECGKQWTKNPRPRTANNPPCIYCGGKLHKRGTNYTCMDCGKSRSVHLVRKNRLYNIDIKRVKVKK